MWKKISREEISQPGFEITRNLRKSLDEMNVKKFLDTSIILEGTLRTYIRNLYSQRLVLGSLKKTKEKTEPKHSIVINVLILPSKLRI